VALKTSKM